MDFFDGKKEIAFGEILFKKRTKIFRFVPKSKRQKTVLRRKLIAKTPRKINIRYGSERLAVQKLAAESGVSAGLFTDILRAKG